MQAELVGIPWQCLPCLFAVEAVRQEQTPTECNIICAIGCGLRGFVRDVRVVAQLAAVSEAVYANQRTGRDMTAR